MLFRSRAAQKKHRGKQGAEKKHRGKQGCREETRRKAGLKRGNTEESRAAGEKHRSKQGCKGETPEQAGMQRGNTGASRAAEGKHRGKQRCREETPGQAKLQLNSLISETQNFSIVKRTQFIVNLLLPYGNEHVFPACHIVQCSQTACHWPHPPLYPSPGEGPLMVTIATGLMGPL